MIKTINDLVAATDISDDMQIEIDLGGAQSLKITVGQLRDYVNPGIPLGELTDVALVDPIDLDVLRYNSATGKWENVQLAESASALDALDDVEITNPVASQYLAYDDQGEVWVNAPFPQLTTALSELSDVEVISVSNDDILKYSTADQKWVNGQLPPVVTSLSALEDVSLTTPSAEQFLKFNGTDWVNASIPEQAFALEELTNVEITGPSDREVLSYNAGQDVWVNDPLPFIPETIQDLDNVTVTTPSNGQFLKYNGSEWVNSALPSIPSTIQDLSNVTITSPAQDQVLRYNSSTQVWQNQTLPSDPDVTFTGMTYVAKNGNDTTGNGSLSKPYLTIQKAIDSASGFRLIMVAHGTYTENIVINNKNNYMIQGIGSSTDSQVAEIIGTITIQGTTTRSRFVNLNINSAVAGTPVVLDSGSQGRHVFTNCSIAHSDASTPGVRVSGGVNFLSFELCNIDKLELVGSPTGLRTVTITNSVVGLTTISSPFYVCQGIRCSAFGPVVHQAGVLYLNYVSLVPKVTTDGITSTCNTGLGQLLIDNCNFQQADLSYARINKTGTCPYGIGVTNRSVSTDVLTGTRVTFQDNSLDTFVGFTPTNYTPVNSSLRAHLQAIDTKLGELEGTLGNTLGIA